MNTVTYSEARNNLKSICDQVQISHDITRIMRKSGDVVLLSAEDWDSIEETLQLVNLPGAIERIRGADDYQPMAQATVGELSNMISHG